MTEFVTFIDDNGRHYLSRADRIMYAFTMDQPDPKASMVNQRTWYLTLGYENGQSFTYTFSRAEARDRVRQYLIPDDQLESL